MRALKALAYLFSGKNERMLIAQALFFLALCGALACLWTSLKPAILEQPEYTIDPAKDIRLWNPPPWIQANFINEALEYLPAEAKQKTFNSLDKALVPNLIRAFSDHPWVERVEKIVVSFPARVDVELKFRSPIALVDPSPDALNETLDLLEERFPGDKFLYLVRFETSIDQQGPTRAPERYVVDAAGRKLPEDYLRLCADDADELPRVATFGPYNEYVPNAAALVEFLRAEDAWDQYGVRYAYMFRASGQKDPIYFLACADDKLVKWGAFAAPEERDKNMNAQYDPRAKQDRDAVKKALYDCQRRKLALWRKAKDESSVDLGALDLAETADAR